jgi:hypothetical protein
MDSRAISGNPITSRLLQFAGHLLLLARGTAKPRTTFGPTACLTAALPVITSAKSEGSAPDGWPPPHNGLQVPSKEADADRAALPPKNGTLARPTNFGL